MAGDVDFEISGCLRARRLHAARPPRTTTSSEQVQIAHRDGRHGHEGELQPDGMYEDVEIEKTLRAEIAME